MLLVPTISGIGPVLQVARPAAVPDASGAVQVMPASPAPLLAVPEIVIVAAVVPKLVDAGDTMVSDGGAAFTGGAGPDAVRVTATCWLA